VHSTDLSSWKHDHQFGAQNPLAKKRAYVVTVLTAVMMVAEIACGQIFHSMALFADGWHMGIACEKSDFSGPKTEPLVPVVE